ncbi:MAG: TetR/AcrR family transcriptional regulator [Actinobacteria bacterium]|nr:TetR/AcrR family transcriptional regulator [Actinomycetota bacterium]
MARPRKEEAREDTRGEIIQAAWRLFSSSGYDATPLESILSMVGISKGTFYYYFSGKEDLLDAVVETVIERIAARVEGMSRDESIPPLERMRRFLEGIAVWKMDNLEIVREVAEVVYRPQNAIIREKMNRRTVEKLAPVLAEILAQGEREGVFFTGAPRDMAEIVLRFFAAMAELQVEDYLRAAREGAAEAVERLVRRAELYIRAMERMLGAEEGSVYTLDRRMVERAVGKAGNNRSGPRGRSSSRALDRRASTGKAVDTGKGSPGRGRGRAKGHPGGG